MFVQTHKEIECYALHLINKKNGKRYNSIPNHTNFKPKPEVVKENIEHAKRNANKNKQVNLKKYKYIYDEFFKRDGPVLYESSTGEIFDEERAYSNIEYFMFVIATLAFIEEIKATYPKKEKRIPITDERKRYYRVKTATPCWADMEAIKAIYRERIDITKENGEMYHVDHIIPIKHHLVCGLHVEQNLRIIRASENLSKNNSFYID